MIDLTYLKEWAWEREYLSQIFAFVPEVKAVAVHWRSERMFRRWFPQLRSKFVLDKLRLPRSVDQDTVVILLSDELYRIPGKLPALAVLKQYASQADPFSVPFPLGYRRDFPEITPKPIEERTIDVGFLGRMYPHRKEFLTKLSQHPKLQGFRLNLTSEHRVSVPEYSEFLNDTKISLCLRGNASPETFRFYESMKTGCVVVSARMPDNGLYRKHPGVQLDDIDDLDGVATKLKAILEDGAEHASMQQRSLEAWEAQYSPRAMAAMIKGVVEARAAAPAY